MTDNIREKLVGIVKKAAYVSLPSNTTEFHIGLLVRNLAANGVTVQESAHWKDVLDCGVGNCFGICSNCLTQQKAASYASLMTEYRHCRWCGARMVYQPPKGEKT